MFAMKKYGFVGASWRNDYAVTTNIGYYLTPQLTLGYAHDFSLNTYASQLGTSNEFMLSWSFGENSKMERLENEIKKLKENDRRKMEQYEEMLEERLEEMGDEIEVEEAAKKAGKEAAKETLEQYLKDNPNIGQGGAGKSTAPSTPAEGQTLLPTRYLRVQHLPVRVRRPHQKGVCQPTPNLNARILCRGRVYSGEANAANGERVLPNRAWKRASSEIQPVAFTMSICVNLMTTSRPRRRRIPD